MSSCKLWTRVYFWNIGLIHGEALRGKDREILQREQLFLDVARHILLQDGYSEVSVSRVAERTSFSRGTVYQRFGSKEELITALGIQCRKRLLETVARAAAFDAPPRARMVGIGEAIKLYFSFNPDDQRILKIIDSELILHKVAEDQRKQMDACDIKLFATVLGVIQDAIDGGTLELRNGATPQGILLAFWSMIDGAFAAANGGAPLEEAGITDPIGEAIRNGHYLLDGYGWRPLSHEADYERSSEQIRAEIGRAFNTPAGVEHTATVHSST